VARSRHHPAARHGSGSLTRPALALVAAALCASAAAALGVGAAAAAALTPAEPGASAPAAPQVLASVASPSSPVSIATGTLRVHRAENPNYRPALLAPRTPPANLRPVDHVDRLRLRLGRRGTGGDPGAHEWEVDAGRTWRPRSSIYFKAAGVQGDESSPNGLLNLRGIALEARRERIEAALGDFASQGVGGAGRLDRLRGAGARLEIPDGSVWRAFAGGRAPGTGTASPHPTYAGVFLDAKPCGAASVSSGVLGFVTPAATGEAGGSADPSRRHGATISSAAGFSDRTGQVILELAAQAHDLDGGVRVGMQPAVALSGKLGPLSLAAREGFASPAYRVATADGLRLAGARQDRAGARINLGRSAEAHAAADHQIGGDPDFEGGSLSFGGSTRWSGPALYLSGECSWSRRGESPGDRRVLLQASRTSAAGLALQAHALSASSPGSASRFQVQATVSRPEPGGRVGLVSRLDWAEAVVDRATLALEVSARLPRAGATVWATLGAAAERDQDFQPRFSEAALRISFTPRGRDRMELSAERVRDSGPSTLDLAAEYALEESRYAPAPGAGVPAARGRRVEARVVRASDGAAVENALVSLDGREFRFTDAEGRVVFESVIPGAHELAVEEGSLPAGERTLGPARVTLRVEGARTPDPVLFEVGRPEVRTRF
jgi:hypothetical protein